MHCGAGIRLLMGDRGNVMWPAREAVITHDRLLENRVKELHSSTLMMRRDAFDLERLPGVTVIDIHTRLSAYDFGLSPADVETLVGTGRAADAPQRIASGFPRR